METNGRFGIYDSRSRVVSLGFRGFRVLMLEVWDLGYRAQAFGLRAQGLGFRDSPRWRHAYLSPRRWR